jgi:hypothetical protein
MLLKIECVGGVSFTPTTDKSVIGEKESSGSSGSSVAIIAGVVSSVVVVIGLAIFLFCFLKKRKAKSEKASTLATREIRALSDKNVPTQYNDVPFYDGANGAQFEAAPYDPSTDTLYQNGYQDFKFVHLF